jgi:hypothetical protein
MFHFQQSATFLTDKFVSKGRDNGHLMKYQIRCMFMRASVKSFKLISTNRKQELRLIEVSDYVCQQIIIRF